LTALPEKNEHPPGKPMSGRRVAMVAYSYYESDNRILRYARALAARGDQVDVFALRRGYSVPEAETLEGVNVFRIQERLEKTETSKLTFASRLVRFLVKASWALAKEHRKEPYAVVHVHNMPDFLVFAALYPKMAGAKVVLDIHDIVPEFFSSKFGTSSETLMVRALRWVEKLSAALADHVIVANHLWAEKFELRTHSQGKCSVFINNVDSTAFYPGRRQRTDEKQIILYPGGLQWHQGLDLALHAFQRVSRDFPNAELHIYGDGIMKPHLVSLARELGFNRSVKFFDPLPANEISGVMANADLGIVPKRADGFGNEAYSTKIMEFMAVGVPVVVSATKVDRHYFNDSVVRFFESGNFNALADAMTELLRDEEKRRSQVREAFDYVSRNCWDLRKQDYLALVDNLCNGRPNGAFLETSKAL
jgi:glycosyltransferase involved in cell wall biosynthesis